MTALRHVRPEDGLILTRACDLFQLKTELAPKANWREIIYRTGLGGSPVETLVTATGTDRSFGAEVSSTISVWAETEEGAREDLWKEVYPIYKEHGRVWKVFCDD